MCRCLWGCAVAVAPFVLDVAVGDPAKGAIKIAVAGSQLGDSGDQIPLVCLEDQVRLGTEVSHVFAPFLWY